MVKVGESPSRGGLGYASSSLYIFGPILCTGGIIPGHRMVTARISSPEGNQAFTPCYCPLVVSTVIFGRVGAFVLSIGGLVG